MLVAAADAVGAGAAVAVGVGVGVAAVKVTGAEASALPSTVPTEKTQVPATVQSAVPCVWVTSDATVTSCADPDPAASALTGKMY